ncbi:MAG: glycosyltransferase family 2 protein [Chloroflexi bacterium]|nr:MAG: glycosyltransferase family 2 protein [Chloroflexota bacterium]
MNRVAIVVLNYKGIEDTISCLASLSKQSYENFKIVLIENGSNDGSAEEFKKLELQRGGSLHTIYNQKNLGFAGGVNCGIRWAIENEFDYVALFNNDAVADKDWLNELVSTAKEKQSGITTGLLLHEDGKTIDSTGDWYTTWGLPFPRNRNDPSNNAELEGYVFSGSGGASLFSTAMFKKIGLFDEDFFAYYEDTDLSFRAQLAGYKVYYQPKAIAYHKQGATSSKMPGFAVMQTFKNLPLLLTKNVPNSLLLKTGTRFWFAYFLMLGHAIKKGNGTPAIKGYFQSIKLFWSGTLAKRKIIQTKKIATDDYIKSILWADLPPDQTGLRKLRKMFTKNA